MRTYNGFVIKTEPRSPSLWKCSVEGHGGSLPNELLGAFTSVGAITSAIDRYLTVKEAAVEKRNGKTRTAG